MIALYSLAIAALAILLGFIALLKQKTYLDSTTGDPTEVELPLVGKLKTNYPALLFVFIGFALVYATIQKTLPPPLVEWQVKGSIVAPDSIDWLEGTLKVIPSNYHVVVSRGADHDRVNFTIDGHLPEGHTFEELVNKIDFSHPEYSAGITPKKEFDSLQLVGGSLLVDHSETTREYLPLKLEGWEQQE